MYIETLQHPHPSLLSEDHAQEPLTEVLDSLAAEYSTEPLQLVGQALSTVRHTLRFPDNEKRDPFAHDPILLPMNNLQEKQFTNCVGFTIVASECLERLGIPHLMAYGNGHAWDFVTLDGNIYMRDTLQPHFDARVNDAFPDTALPHIHEQIETSQRAVVRFDSGRAASLANVAFENLDGRHPFVFHRPGTKAYREDKILGSSEVQELRHFQEPRTLIVSLYAPEVGRTILHNYADFVVSIDQNKPYAALTHLKAMGDLYPDMDARQSHGEIFMLVRQLLAHNRADLADQAISAYFSSFRISSDSRITDMEGDCWKAVYDHTHDSSFAQRARHLWQEAARKSRVSIFKAKVVHKLLQTERQISQVSGTIK